MTIKTHLVIALFSLTALSACSEGTVLVPGEIADPDESKNRQAHEFNKFIYESFARRQQEKQETSPNKKNISNIVGNIVSNIEAPRGAVNNLLQGRPQEAAQTALSFAINTTIGLGGIFDVASKAQINRRSTDFGETLYVWGVGEGRYVELPVIGGVTERDALGKVIDLGLDPRVYLGLPLGFSIARLGLKITNSTMKVGKNSNTVAAIFDSADSYSQARLYAVQSRRHELGQTQTYNFIDPYKEE